MQSKGTKMTTISISKKPWHSIGSGIQGSRNPIWIIIKVEEKFARSSPSSQDWLMVSLQLNQIVVGDATNDGQKTDGFYTNKMTGRPCVEHPLEIRPHLRSHPGG